eukprot:SAG31_NODE_469_length_15244_cov_11.537141_12_plen_42_part_00
MTCTAVRPDRSDLNLLVNVTDDPKYLRYGVLNLVNRGPPRR